MKFAFVAKHRTTAGGMAMRCAESAAVELPCLAEPLSQRQSRSARGSAARSRPASPPATAPMAHAGCGVTCSPMRRIVACTGLSG